MKRSKPVVAFIYDFDGTLSPGNMQEYAFMDKLGMSSEIFWSKCKNYVEKQQSDKILAYMYTMLDEASKCENDVKIRKEDFKSYGKNIELFKGVPTWFERINAYAKENKLTAEHYIISSGLTEMIEGTEIYKEFHRVFACKYAYDKHGVAMWPALAINFTEKTQYLFRINKGCFDITDDKGINDYIKEEERSVPFKHMIYLGDGDTDIPCMKLVKDNGGHSIAVYPPNNDATKAKKLIGQKRVDFIAPADYSEGKKLEEIAKHIMDQLKTEDELNKLRKI